MSKHNSDPCSLEYWNKAHLCGLLSLRYGLTRFLEISTTTTGFKFVEVRQLGFERCLRMVYRYGGTIDDDLPVDFSSATDENSGCFDDIRRRGLGFDLVFVDPHHTYACSYRDIAQSFALLEPGGAMVIHDCRPPPDAHIVSPEFMPGEWCGVTYKAYLDFVLGNPALDYFTVDADYGCGVILKPRSFLDRLKCRAGARRDRALASEWRQTGANFDAAFELFKRNERELLRLVDFAGLRARLRA